MDRLSENDRKTAQTFLNTKNEEITVSSLGTVNTKKPYQILLIIAKYRLFTFKVGKKFKPEKEFFLLDIKEIRSSASDEFVCIFPKDELSVTTSDATDLITAVREFQLTIFPSMSENYRIKLTIPSARIQTLPPADLSFCGGFVRTYNALCDYYGLLPRADVIHDASKVLPYNNITELDLATLQQPVTEKEYRTILESIFHNTYFKSVVVQKFKIDDKVLATIAEIFNYNSSIQKLVLTGLSNCSKDSFNALFTSMSTKKNLLLSHLDLSSNPLDDKSVATLGKVLSSQTSLVEFNISGCNLAPKSMATLLGGLKGTESSMTSLNISSNRLEQDGSTALTQWLSSASVLEKLDLSNTSPVIEAILSCITRSCPGLRVLDLSRNKLTTKDFGWMTTFMKASQGLREFSIAYTGISVEQCYELYLSFITNDKLDGLFLNFAGNKLGPLGANMFAVLGEEAHNIEGLDLTENEFGDDGLEYLFEGLIPMSQLKFLNVGKNFRFSGNEQRVLCMARLADFLVDAKGELSTLTLEGTKTEASSLVQESSSFFKALGKTRSLSTLDISGNCLGDRGIRAFGYSLELNHSLKSISFDDNDISLPAFESFKFSFSRNFGVTDLRLPSRDIVALLKKNPTPAELALLKKILDELDSYGTRNHLPGTGMGASATTTSLAANDLILKWYASGIEADSDTKLLLRDLQNNAGVMLSLNKIQAEVAASLADTIKAQLKTFSKKLFPFLLEQMQSLSERLTKELGEQYREVLEDEGMKTLQFINSSKVKEITPQLFEGILVSLTASKIGSACLNDLIGVVQLSSEFFLAYFEDRLGEILDEEEIDPDSQSTAGSSVQE
eukprot:TRINITY_DN4325_c0_g1_i1.p1 TRINITY_DN4325_c0_g1~~TRINITY_DN4325_c0_g1_i1.p1  ORF type:complete len:844 (+),score=211.59 TRINITY_DN4325_c0_g1_i1:81-2612(+)